MLILHEYKAPLLIEISTVTPGECFLLGSEVHIVTEKSRTIDPICSIRLSNGANFTHLDDALLVGSISTHVLWRRNVAI